AAGVDRQVDDDVRLLEVARVLDGRDERKRTRDLDRRRSARRQIDALRKRTNGDERIAVLAARSAACRRTAEAFQEDRERAGADEIAVGEEMRGRDDNARHVLVVELLR